MLRAYDVRVGYTRGPRARYGGRSWDCALGRGNYLDVTAYGHTPAQAVAQWIERIEEYLCVCNTCRSRWPAWIKAYVRRAGVKQQWKLVVSAPYADCRGPSWRIAYAILHKRP